MAHHHAHGAAVLEGHSGGRRLLLALGLNVGIAVAQIVGGLLSRSLALLADAVHNASDAAAIGVSYVSRRIARREADRKRTFGYRRSDTVGALVNLVTLVVIAVYLIGHAVERFFNPQPIDGVVMLVVGIVAFVEDMVSALLLHRDSSHSLNIRSAYLHMVGDTLATVAVIAGSLAIMWFDVYLVDPLLTIAIAIYILVHSYRALRETIRILMNSVPEGLDFDAVVREMGDVEGVRDVHHVHIWQLDEHRTALEAHVAVENVDLAALEDVKRRLKARLGERFGIQHSTLELECDPCPHPHDAVVPRE